MCRVLPDNRPAISDLNFSEAPQFLFDKMFKNSVVVSGVNVYVATRSATVVGLGSGDEVILPSSAFFPFLAASMRAGNIGRKSFDGQEKPSIMIGRNGECQGGRGGGKSDM
jgi:hypothetical protein